MKANTIQCIWDLFKNKIGVKLGLKLSILLKITIRITGLSKNLGQDVGILETLLETLDRHWRHWVFDPCSFAHLTVITLPCQQRPTFLSLDLFCILEKDSAGTSKIFFDHAGHVARI